MDERLSECCYGLPERTEKDRLSIGDLAGILGHRSIAALLVVFALPMFLPVPAPGISVGFGIPMMFISAQLALGRRHLWLPTFLARQSITRSSFAGLVEKVAPVLQRLESVVHPRSGLMLAGLGNFPSRFDLPGARNCHHAAHTAWPFCAGHRSHVFGPWLA